MSVNDSQFVVAEVPVLLAQWWWQFHVLVVRHSLRCDFDLLNSVIWFLTGNWLFSYYFTWICEWLFFIGIGCDCCEIIVVFWCQGGTSLSSALIVSGPYKWENSDIVGNVFHDKPFFTTPSAGMVFTGHNDHV